MNILPVVNQIIMLFIIAGLGLLLRKLNVFTDPVIKGINSTIILVTWPAMILMTTQKPYTDEILKDFLTVFLISFAILSITVIVLFVLCSRLKNERLRPVIAMLCTMPNAGYIGLPIIQAVYGDAGTIYLAAYIVGFNLVLWTACVSLFTGFKTGIMRGMLNPGFIAAIIGIALFVLRIELPTPVHSAVNQLGGLNTPLAMLLLGSRLDTLRLRQLADGKLWIAMLIKLLIIPAASLFVLKAFGMSGMVLGVLVLSTAMPSASACQMLAEKYERRVDFAAKGVSVSTLLCILTIPLMLLLMG